MFGNPLHHFPLSHTPCPQVCFFYPASVSPGFYDHRLAGWNEGIFPMSGGWRSEIMVITWPGSGEGRKLSSCCVHMAGRGEVSTLVSLLRRAQKSSWGLHLHDLIPTMLGDRVSKEDLRGDTNTPSTARSSPPSFSPFTWFHSFYRSTATSLGQQRLPGSMSPFWVCHFLHNIPTGSNL